MAARAGAVHERVRATKAGSCFQRRDDRPTAMAASGWGLRESQEKATRSDGAIAMASCPPSEMGDACWLPVGANHSHWEVVKRWVC